MPKLGYVDWRKPNNLLALELRITGERVRQMRVERNAPEPLFTHVWSQSVRQCWIIWTKRRVIAGLPPRLAEKHLGFPLPSGSRVLRFAKVYAGLYGSKWKASVAEDELDATDSGPRACLANTEIKSAGASFQIEASQTTMAPAENGGQKSTGLSKSFRR